MSAAPDPAEIFHRAAEEGTRRLEQSFLELVATSFIAGFTIVFGIVALGIVYAAVEPAFGEGMFADAIAGGVLVALLSHLLVAVDSTASRIAVAYIVGFLLALGPFDHVIVTVLHVFFGMRFGAEIGVRALATTIGVSTIGNLVCGLGLVTFSHVAQATGARE